MHNAAARCRFRPDTQGGTADATGRYADMHLAPDQLQRDIETLRHGGSEAMELFLEISEQLYDEGGEEALENWVTLAAPALPEDDRSGLVASLLSELFGIYDTESHREPGPPPTLN
jgi:hypothetical protein